MALTKSSVILYTSQSVPAGLSKATAVLGNWIDVRDAYRMCVRWRLMNGASAPGVAPTLLVQTSQNDGTTIYDEYFVGGDVVANSNLSGPIWLDDTTMYVRVGVYGHTVNAVSAEASVQKITAL